MRTRPGARICPGVERRGQLWCRCGRDRPHGLHRPVLGTQDQLVVPGGTCFNNFPPPPQSQTSSGKAQFLGPWMPGSKGR